MLVAPPFALVGRPSACGGPRGSVGSSQCPRLPNPPPFAARIYQLFIESPFTENSSDNQSSTKFFLAICASDLSDFADSATYQHKRNLTSTENLSRKALTLKHLEVLEFPLVKFIHIFKGELMKGVSD